MLRLTCVILIAVIADIAWWHAILLFSYKLVNQMVSQAILEAVVQLP